MDTGPFSSRVILDITIMYATTHDNLTYMFRLLGESEHVYVDLK